MRKLLIAALMFLAPVKSHAVGAGCQATSGAMALEKVRSDASGTQIFGCYNRSIDTLSSNALSQNLSSTTAYNLAILYLNQIGGRTVGPMGIRISSPMFTDSNAYINMRGSATVEGAGGLAVTYGLNTGTLTATGQITVIGSATFSGGLRASSGTFTQTGTDYSIASSSGINVITGPVSLASGGGGYIRFPDGTVQLTAAAGNTIGLASTQTWTGANTHTGAVIVTSGIVVGAQSFTNSGASTFGSGWVTGNFTLIASTIVTTASSLTFTNLQATMTYVVEVNMIQNTSAGNLGFRFNSDSGANYRHIGRCANVLANNDPNSTADGFTSAIFVNETNNLISASATVYSMIRFRTKANTGGKVIGVWQTGVDDTVGTMSECVGMGAYAGSASLTSVTVMTSAGTISGRVNLYGIRSLENYP